MPPTVRPAVRDVDISLAGLDRSCHIGHRVGEVVVSMRLVSVFAKGPDCEIEQLGADLRGAIMQASHHATGNHRHETATRPVTIRLPMLAAAGVERRFLRLARFDHEPEMPERRQRRAVTPAPHHGRTDEALQPEAGSTMVAPPGQLQPDRRRDH